MVPKASSHHSIIYSWQLLTENYTFRYMSYEFSRKPLAINTSESHYAVNVMLLERLLGCKTTFSSFNGVQATDI